MFLLTTSDDFIGCCETVCQNGSALCNTSYVQNFSPRLFTNEARIYYNYRDLFAELVPTAIVFIASAGSYIIYKRSSLKSTIGLEVRMLLLPVILSFAVGGYLIGHDAINWVDSAITDTRVPGITVFIILHIMWDSAGLVFASIVLFFNVTLRRIIWRLFRWKRPKVVNNLRDLSEKTISSFATSFKSP